MKVYNVYILKCSDGTYYTGFTSNLFQRIISHESGFYKNSYTSKRLPVEIVFYAEFTEVPLAIEYEKRIKKWSKAKKEALIEERYDDLIQLARKKFGE